MEGRDWDPAPFSKYSIAQCSCLRGHWGWAEILPPPAPLSGICPQAGWELEAQGRGLLEPERPGHLGPF